MELSTVIREKLKTLPDAPGCYLMRDRDGKIIYIGKAASLRKRVQSYFRSHTKRTAQPKIRSLISSIADFDIVVLKSRVHFRRGFHETGLAGAIFEVDAPGLGPADLTTISYENIPKDIYPVYQR